MLGNTEAQYQEQAQAEDHRVSAQNGLNVEEWVRILVKYSWPSYLGIRMELKFGHVIDRALDLVTIICWLQQWRWC